MTSWRELIEELADGDEIISCTLSEEELNVKFNDRGGKSEGKPFTAWSLKYVYFSDEYDGLDSVSRVYRNPKAEDAVSS